MKTGLAKIIVSPQNLRRRKQRKRLRELLPKAKFGRSDRIRTCGIDVPNVARYQLRHTPKCENIEFFRFFRKWSNMWSNRFYRGFCERAECQISQCFQGLSAFFVSSESVVGVLLPKHARYQLRHTPKNIIIKARLTNERILL